MLAANKLLKLTFQSTTTHHSVFHKMPPKSKRIAKKKSTSKAANKAKVPQRLPDSSLPVSTPTHRFVRVSPPSPSPSLAMVQSSPPLTPAPEVSTNIDVTLASAMANFEPTLTVCTSSSLPATGVAAGLTLPAVTSEALSKAASSQLSEDEVMGKHVFSV
jgi:hypothetical protein